VLIHYTVPIRVQQQTDTTLETSVVHNDDEDEHSLSNNSLHDDQYSEGELSQSSLETSEVSKTTLETSVIDVPTVKFGFLRYQNIGEPYLFRLGRIDPVPSNVELTKTTLGTSEVRPYDTFILLKDLQLFSEIYAQNECGFIKSGSLVQVVCLVGSRAQLLQGQWFEYISNFGQIFLRKCIERKVLYKAGAGTTEA
jgi:hypothetical protein